MTLEEETLFRAAARQALELSSDIVIVSAEHPDQAPPFSLVAFEDHVVGIIIPESWETEEGAEAACQAILRQESKSLAGQALD